MLDAWLNRTRNWLAASERLLALSEQELALWGMSRALKAQPAHSALVYLWGAVGAGKTSLVRHVLRQQPPTRLKRICGATADEWSCWLTARETSGQPLIAADAVDVIVCENLQTLSDPRGAGDLLARWIDQARSEGLVLIVTSDRLPSQIQGLSPRLVSRLRGGLLAGIRPLGEDSRRRLSRFWSGSNSQWESRQSSVPSAFLTAGQLRAHLTQQVDSQSPSLPDAAPRFSENSLEMIAEAVARDFQISLDELCSGSRTQQLKVPRGVAMSLARELTPCSLLRIGHYFGCRSHTSVVRSCTRLQELLPEAPSLRQQIQLLRAKLRHDLSADCG